MTRSARFNVVGPQDKKFTHWSLLDELMSEVPGKDNYMANITDTSLMSAILSHQTKNKSLLNVGFYHRRYKVDKTDAMGQVYSLRGFCDPNIFMAETTQFKIPPLSLKECVKRKCVHNTKRMSYAIPMEIIYLTPLSNWNPYNLEHYPLQGTDVVTENGKRTGGWKNEKAFNGTNDRLFYRTPAEFFSGREVGQSLADTVKGSVGVLDPEGNLRKVTASGIRIFLPNIAGVGVLRTRYPIVPVHGESSGVWKELNALKDIVKSLVKHEKYLLQKLPRASEVNNIASESTESQSSKLLSSINVTTTFEKKEVETDQTVDAGSFLTLTLSTATELPPGEHSHSVELTKEESECLKSGKTVTALTSQDNGHSHEVSIQYFDNRYTMTSCDNVDSPCWDGHTSCLLLEEEDTCPSNQITNSGNLTSKYPGSSVSKENMDRIIKSDGELHLLLFPVFLEPSLAPVVSPSNNDHVTSANITWAKRLARLRFGRHQQPNLADPDGRSPGILAKQFSQFFNNP